MIDMRRTMSVFVLLVVMILLFSSLMSNSSDFELERTEQQLPDVTITNLTFSQSEPKEGENITIFVTLRNNESFPITDLTIRLVNLRLEQNISEKQVSIDENDEKTIDFNWTAQGGSNSISALLIPEVVDLEEPIDSMSKEIWVEPEPIGDVYSPLFALIFIFIVIFGSVIIPSIFAFLTNRDPSQEKD